MITTARHTLLLTKALKLKLLITGAHMAQSGIVRNAFPEPKFLSNQTGYRSDLGIKIKLIT